MEYMALYLNIGNEQSQFYLQSISRNCHKILLLWILAEFYAEYNLL